MVANKIIKKDFSKKILYLTKDLSLIRAQLDDKITLNINDIKEDDLLDDINTDVMTPAWVCFHYDPIKIAKRAYAGLIDANGQRVIKDEELYNGNLQAIVSGHRKGTGSSRETAAQCEHFCGINLIFAKSFAPIHAKNNINLGQLMGNLDLLKRFENGEQLTIEDFLKGYDSFAQKIIIAGGLFSALSSIDDTKIFTRQEEKHKSLPPLNMWQKILAKKIINTEQDVTNNNEPLIVKVDKGYSHEFTTAQAHMFLQKNYGENYEIEDAKNFACFEDHLIYAESIARFKPFLPLIHELRQKQKEFIAHTGVKDYSAIDNVSQGICHEVAKEDLIDPCDLVLATDSHTCMGGALNTIAFGVGATEYASILKTGLAVIENCQSIRFDLVGQLSSFCTAKDVVLFILKEYASKNITLGKVLEFGGAGVASLSIDERATICNMATECGAKTAIFEPDDMLVSWLLQRRDYNKEELTAKLSYPDEDCLYEDRFTIDLASIKPIVAKPYDPQNCEYIENMEKIKIDIAYGGSCTAGKCDDIALYAKGLNGKKVHQDVKFYIQYGSSYVEKFAKQNGFHDIFVSAGVKIITPGCGACIGAGPGVSDTESQVTISAINRNFKGRSGPGKLYLASPLTVAASAVNGYIARF